MRLTLRTLLAYLDDTLDPSEIKSIGDKVAESETAKELIARIRQITRKRRLPNPDDVEANDVAEYLDDELDPELLGDLEKKAMESDPHLAEIAACHQILALIMGEPALVPPKAKERMYGLVKGREALPGRKAKVEKKSLATLREEEEDEVLKVGWMRWVLPVAALLLLGLLGLTIWRVLPDHGERDGRMAVRETQTGGGEKVTEPEKNTGKEGEKGGDGKSPAVEPDKEKPPITEPAKEPIKEPAKEPGKEPAKEPVKKDEGPTGAGPDRATQPNKTRVAIAKYMGGLSDLPATLVSRRDGQEEWQRYQVGNSVFSDDTLMTLPGFTGVLQTRNGVALLLRGNLRDLSLAEFMKLLSESAVKLHENPQFDLDMTLLRGRIFLTNRKEKGPARVRLRFESEIWDLTLASPGDEICVDLVRFFTSAIDYRKGEGPRVQAIFSVLQGEVDVKIDSFQTQHIEVEPSRWARIEWDSFTRTSGRPIMESRVPPALSKQPPAPELFPEPSRDGLKRLQVALKDLEAMLMNSKKSLDVALREMVDRQDQVWARVVGIQGLAATDHVGPVVDALNDEQDTHFFDRESAFFALQRWVARSAAQSKKLFDPETGTGILPDKKFKKGECQTIIQLLHPLLAEELGKEETYEALAQYLQHRRVAIAEMAFWHLTWLSGPQGLPPGFNAALPQEARERYAARIMEMIEKKQLPPSSSPMPMPMPDKTPAGKAPDRP